MLKLSMKEESMDGKEGFLFAFDVGQLFLKIIGLWPNFKNSKRAEVLALFRFILITLIIVVFINIAQSSNLYKIWGDLDLMTDNISTANLPIAVAVFKMLVLYNKKKAFRPLLEFAQADWASSRSSRETVNMITNARLVRSMSLLCTILGLGTVHGHLAIRTFQEFRLLPGKLGQVRLPFVDSSFPFDYRPSPAYELTWILQYSGALLATFAYTGIYSLFVALMLHLCGQFANLRDRLEFLVEEREDLKKRSFRSELTEIINRHEKLNKFAQVIESIFNPMFLAEIFSCTIQFCLQGFLLISLSSKEGEGAMFLQILFMVVYVMHIGTHLFICCYVAEKLQEESSSIFRAAYNCKWYNLSPKDALLLIMLMNHAKKALKVTAGKFFTFSMSLYAQIFKTSGGYLSMLLAVSNRQPKV